MAKQQNSVNANRCVVVLGPTATGKTRFAVQLAHRLAGEIISVDSRQVYRSLDIGTGKDLIEYGQIPYHLIDVCSPQQEFSLYDYLAETQKVLAKLSIGAQNPIFAGGTGLYLNALLESYQLANAPPDKALRAELSELSHDQLIKRLAAVSTLHNATDIIDRKRTERAIEVAEAKARGSVVFVQIRLQPIVIGLKCSADRLRQKISDRLNNRLKAGMIEEVKSLQESGLCWQRLHQLGLEYRYLSLYLQGQLNRNDMQQKLASAIYQFARKQLKWFRRMERNGIAINWVDADEVGEASLSGAVSAYKRLTH